MVPAPVVEPVTVVCWSRGSSGDYDGDSDSSGSGSGDFDND